MSGCDSQKAESSKDNISTNSIDEGLPRELSQLSLSSASSQDEFYCDKGHSEITLKNLFQYFQSQKLCDVALIAGGCRIPAHKVMLASCSEYFAAMFTGSLRESQLTEITLERVDSQALQALVRYCYTGTIELREETVEVLLSTASLLQLNTVTDACCAFLKKQLDPCNCLGIALFAEQQSCMTLHKSALEYTYQHFMQVVKHQEFLSLQMDQLASLLKSDDLNVITEENVFESLMTWVQHDSANREQYLPTLLKLIKLPLLSSEYLIDKVELACGNVPECQPLIMEAVKWHLLPERRSLLFSHRTRPRTSTIGRLLAIGGMDGYKGASNMEMYDPRTNTWTPFMRMGARRLQFGVAVLQNKLIVVGGRDGLKTLNTVECFDMTSLSWSTLAPMNTHRHGLGVAVLGDGPNSPIYAVGGHDGWIYLNSVERWDACSRTWTIVSPMTGARSTCGVAALRGRLYAVGGRDGGACLRSVECYDPTTNHWTNCAAMTRRRGGVSVCAAGSYLYALGGHEAPANTVGGRLACVERYDPAADSWLLLARLSYGRDAIGSCLLGDRIVAVGGYDGVQYLCVVEVYDSESNCWRKLAPLSTGRAGAAVVAVPPPRNLF
ncbi:kelch-like protein 5 isoform X1 [Ostrinia nubilalis]|uniref:kelch-like protein 5 isoform X1 n=1 Tax=Ostrinia furnacalis TaxID=93504 RepID=UPI00103D511E|nr:kelch-like protein 5 isoform X1 [Ostrinia furnacalis]XP_028175971.1 kelch-like protein 5 isoform X1 [Ostrinia furnacalis]XP_028175972.1 kelch-like protein 5 isoform X2 [Ostrinia furnacalis]XP_028175973.1 kelch-like protein 5 isoform X2 [Ostrinia furnacalis]